MIIAQSQKSVKNTIKSFGGEIFAIFTLAMIGVAGSMITDIMTSTSPRISSAIVFITHLIGLLGLMRVYYTRFKVQVRELKIHHDHVELCRSLHANVRLGFDEFKVRTHDPMYVYRRCEMITRKGEVFKLSLLDDINHHELSSRLLYIIKHRRGALLNWGQFSLSDPVVLSPRAQRQSDRRGRADLSKLEVGSGPKYQDWMRLVSGVVCCFIVSRVLIKLIEMYDPGKPLFYMFVLYFSLSVASSYLILSLMRNLNRARLRVTLTQRALVLSRGRSGRSIRRISLSQLSWVELLLKPGTHRQDRDRLIVDLRASHRHLDRQEELRWSGLRLTESECTELSEALKARGVPCFAHRAEDPLSIYADAV